MAKHQTAAETPVKGANVIAFDVNTLTTPLREQFNTVKRPILDAANKLGLFREKVKELAPRVMRLFIALQAHYASIPGARGFKLVDFCRLLDPTTPEKAKEYTNYRTFYTLRNMQAAYNAGNRDSQAGIAQGGAIRDKAVVVCARLIKVLQQLPGVDANGIVAQIIEESHLSKNVETRLAKRLASLQPMFRVTVSGRGASVSLDPIVMSEKEIKAADNEPMTQGGQTIHVPAAVHEQAAALGRSLARSKTQRRKAS